MASRFDWATPTVLGNNADPVLPTDAATKNYVDSQGGGVAGPNAAVQFNNNGQFGGASGFTTDGANVTIGGNINGVNLVVNTTGNIGLNPLGNIVLFNDYINGLANPRQAQDAATKFYVDSVAQGLQVKDACQAATTAALPTNTYNNGVAGVGATLTASYNGALVVDGVTVQVGNYVLVKDEAAPANNGIYTVTATGSAGSAYVLTRSTQCDQSAEFNGAYTFVQAGTVNRASGWICTASTANPITVGTTAVEFAQFSEAGDYSAGAALSLDGSVFNVNVDGTSIDINPSNQLAIAEGVTLVAPVLESATGDNIVLSGDLSAATVTTTGNVAIGGGVQATANSVISANLQVTGTVTAGGVVTGQLTGPSLYIAATEPDADIIIDPNGGGNISVQNSYINNLNNPVNPQDAATKNYVDSAISDSTYGNANVAAYLPNYSGNIGGIAMDTIAVGISAGNTNQGNNSVAIGSFAGEVNQSDLGIAVGFYAGGEDQGENTVAIGRAAGGQNQGNAAVAVGWQSGYTLQGANAVAVGAYAGQVSQGNLAVAVGFNAGSSNQSNGAIAIGQNSAQTSQGQYSIAMGWNSGQNTQGAGAIAMGTYAGNTTQGNYAVAIGTQAGLTSQSLQAVAIGYNAGYNTQGMQAVAIGPLAGRNNQGANAIAIGVNASQVNQGANSIAIGAGAATPVQSIYQAPSSIVISATGTPFAVPNSGFYVAPIRNDNGNVTQGVYYNTTTRELTYSSIGTSVYSNTNAASYLSTVYTDRLGVSNVIAIGQGTSNISNLSSYNSISIGTNAGNNVSNATSGTLGLSANCIAIGQYAGQNPYYRETIAIGSYAGQNQQSEYCIAIGNVAGQNNQGRLAVAIGGFSGSNNQGTSAVAIGCDAGANTQGQNSVGIGQNAGSNIQGAYSVAIGTYSGYMFQGNYSVAIGDEAGTQNQGNTAVAIGQNAGAVSQGDDTVAIGMNAGSQSQMAGGVAIGAQAGNISQGLNSIAVGANAGFNSQSPYGLAVGVGAGMQQQGLYSTAIGMDAGYQSQGGNAIAIGSTAGSASQGVQAVAIGMLAGNTSQGANAVAIGPNAAGTNQGANSIAIGTSAGNNTQGLNSVAIGIGAGNTNQGNNSVAIGPVAGFNNQGSNSVSVGFGASSNANSVAIGTGAFATANSTIVLNASGANLIAGNTNAMYAKPVRNVNPITLTPSAGLNYNTTTSEVYYSTLTIGCRSNFNSPVGSILQFDNLRIAFPQNIPCPLSIQAVNTNFYATWSGPGITAGNGITIQQGASGWLTVNTGQWTPLVQYSFEQTNDYINVVLADQSIGKMYRIMGQLLSGGTWFGFIERLL